jgi:hypothetical protein
MAMGAWLLVVAFRLRAVSFGDTTAWVTCFGPACTGINGGLL